MQAHRNDAVAHPREFVALPLIQLFRARITRLTPNASIRRRTSTRIPHLPYSG